MIVLDASALLAVLFQEPGAEVVAAQLDGSSMSTLNYSEVLARFARDGHDVARVDGELGRLRLHLVDFDRALAVTAAALVPRCRPLGLSLGDRACLALGLVAAAPVLTADRAWSALDGHEGLCVRVIR